MASRVSDDTYEGNRNPDAGSFPEYGAGRLDDIGTHGGRSNVSDTDRPPAASPLPLRESNKRKSVLLEDWGAEDAEPSEARFKSSRRDSVGQPQSEAADVGEYAMYDPFGDVPVGVQLTEGQSKFVEKNFTTYLTNDVIMEKILQDCPKPACKFIDPPKLDPSMVALMGVESHKPAKFVDKTFVRIQTKAADVLGPLGALWTKLDEIRRGREEELDVSDLLRLAEKSVMLVGQVYVYATHQRRHAILTRILKDPGSAVETLKDGEDELRTGLKNGALFGEEFHKLLHHKAKGSKESKEIRQELGRPDPRPRPQTFQPFRQGAPRGFRGASRGFVARIRGRGRSVAARGGRSVSYSRGFSRPGGDKTRWVRAFFAFRGRVRTGKGRMLARLSRTPGLGKYKCPEGGPVRTGDFPSSETSAQRGFEPGTQEMQRRTGDSRTENCLFPEQLEENHFGPGCSEHGRRTESRFLGSSSPVGGATLAKVLEVGAGQAAGGNRENDWKASDQESLTCKGPVFESPVSQAEEGWQFQTDFQSEKAECVCKIRALQNGRHDDVGRFAGEKGLDDEDRSEGCLLLCSNCTSASEIFPVQVEGGALRIPGAPVRPSFSPEDIHEAAKAGYGFAEASRTQDDHLPGRFVSVQQRRKRTDTRQGHSDLGLTDPGVCLKLGEIPFDSHKDHGVPRSDGGFRQDVIVASIGQSRGYQGPLQPIVGPGNDHSERIVPSSWETDEYHQGGPSSATALQTSPDGEDKCSNERKAELRSSSPAYRGGSQGVEVVDGVVGAGEWQTVDNTEPRLSHYDRCFQERVGSSVPGGSHPGSVGQRGDGGAHKPPRAQSGEICNHGFCEESRRPSYSYEVGQQYNSGPDKQDGRNEVDRPIEGDQAVMVLLPHENDHSYCRASAGEIEPGGGPAVKGFYGCQQLETGGPNFSGAGEQMGSIQGGHVCRQAEQASGNVLQLEARPVSSSNGCFHDAVGLSERVHVSTVLRDRQVSGEGAERKGHSGAGSTNLASSTMVPASSPNAGGLTNPVATHEKVTGVSTRRTTPSLSSGQHHTGGLESVWQRSRQQGLSERAATLVTRAWRKSTACAYNGPWNRWVSWCGGREINPLQATVGQLSNFLAEKFEEGLEYSTLNVYRSALSAFHPTVEGYKVGQHPVIASLLHGAFNEKPPKPRYTDTWEVSKVLEWMKGLGLDGDLPLKVLTWKLAMLLALTGACRGSELKSLKVSLMQDKGTEIWFRIDGLTKTKRPSKPHITLKWAQYDEDSKLDVTRSLRTYVERTGQLRGKEDQLFISHTKPHKAVETCTIARWLKGVMESVGIDVGKYKAHSTRAAATSRARQLGLSVEQIVERANWSRATTFHKFYNKEVQVATGKRFQDKVLQM